MTLIEADVAKDVDTKSWTIHYNEAGPADGHPVILIHGGGPGATGWSNYNPNIEAIAAAGLRVIAPDLPGWGASSEVDFSTYDQVQAVCELLDALGIEKAAFVGNSMGGHTSLRMAIEHPDRVTHLITMGAPIQMKPILFGAGGGPSEGLKIMAQTWSDYSPEQMKRLVEIMVFDKERFATPELCRQRSEAVAKRPEHVANVLAAAPKAPITIWVDPNRLSEITAPALLIHGRDDRVVTFETALVLAANIPDSRAHVINRCGHWAQLEHADEFNRLVADFVRHH
ncbi:alpha/beta fold hydrolase [Nocardia africana]|uniref:2-hydroxy-6-oxo-6-phenylhexa-2,4-dienoate hydrolase n=1 Tax=Nocardia africana TaxID=134964 RepID=A0A378X128_9NOCA|nr:alpha/beta hydrolase [Nocardia africana]MCC3312305.1 alpha/beta fold hydrolase [Nocardia africana]SUA46384.1 2-hydroxy-6-oxo-6-phenylhexa-2,4-dienoate hydrolase [Nocardia africana]